MCNIEEQSASCSIDASQYPRFPFQHCRTPCEGLGDKFDQRLYCNISPRSVRRRGRDFRLYVGESDYEQTHALNQSCVIL
jgi:hypothetical protein